MKIKEMVLLIAEYFEVDVGKPRVVMFTKWLAAQKYSEDTIKDIYKNILESCRFFPTIADVIQFNKNKYLNEAIAVVSSEDYVYTKDISSEALNLFDCIGGYKNIRRVYENGTLDLQKVSNLLNNSSRTNNFLNNKEVNYEARKQIES